MIDDLSWIEPYTTQPGLPIIGCGQIILLSDFPLEIMFYLQHLLLQQIMMLSNIIFCVSFIIKLLLNSC